MTDEVLTGTSHQKHVLGMEESSSFSHQEDSYILKPTLVEKDKGSVFLLLIVLEPYIKPSGLCLTSLVVSRASSPTH